MGEVRRITFVATHGPCRWHTLPSESLARSPDSVTHEQTINKAPGTLARGILYEVLMLARLGHSIKKELPPVRDGDIDHCRLWGPLRTDTCLDGPGLGAHEGQQLGWGEGVMMFDHRLIVPDGQPFGSRGKP
jgi:hypothetical protein